ncbi:sensor histidine kinase [Streptomyces lateritius]|uniref:sensor histidine kinase n=1 Tax=Streptomyces lateritius TaxID=67313 RepID=UPI001C8B86CE|nr:ATP-binding protein [Streptomyces lateritius]MBX9421188.1 ATP-binding protein [Streptomyces lateritius]
MSASPTPFRPALIAALLTAAASGALAAAATTAAPAGVRPALGWFAVCGALLLSAAAFSVTWYARVARALGRRAEVLSAELASRDAYVSRFKATAEREAAELKERHEAEAADHAARAEELVRAQRAEAEELVRAHRAEAARLAEERTADLERLEGRLRRAESARSAAMAAAANAAGRMQALATSMMADLREMEHRHADEDVLTDLLHLDHRTAQAGRLADSVAVLTGARSGRRWARPIVMESILRGAMGRIGGYQRVRLHSGSDAAVAGHAAEGVMHALAELLDNAANFSPPSAEVHVYVEEVPAGIVITVEDSGLAMSDVQLRRAEAAVGSAAQDLAGLSGTRLGLHVVGRLARKHGMTVSFRPSARGGTGALLMLPQELISHVTAEPAGTSGEPPLPVSGRGVTSPAPDRMPVAPPAAPPAVTPAAPAVPRPPEPETVHESAGGAAEAEADGIVLPRRRRGETLASQLKNAEAPSPSRPAAPRTGTSSGTTPRFGSFQRAVRAAGAAPAGGPGTAGARSDGAAPDPSGSPGPATDDLPAGTPVPAGPQDPTSAPRPSQSSNPPYSEGNPR